MKIIIKITIVITTVTNTNTSSEFKKIILPIETAEREDDLNIK